MENDDEVLMARLRDVFAADAPPAEAVDLAKGLFGLRTLDAELAALTADSDSEADSEVDAVAVRGSAGTRLLSFESADLAIEIEVSGTGPVRRVVGQVVPEGAGTIEVRQPTVGGGRTVEVDGRGRFTIDDVRPEPLNLTCRRPGARPVTTQWLGIA
jgi:hypothetical protein